MVEYLEGILKIANIFLAIVAGVIAATLWKASKRRSDLRPWLFLIPALLLFMVQEILGALRAFQRFESLFFTHIIPTGILAFLIIALVLQLLANEGKL
ncbi:TPA: hypothetical protein HA361_02200 [Candidatus Woesearchaeota archaeon]|nr:hypothetical protein [Candidatus Woesearchaeota archaeon]HII69395.1 hypothetical protein [Candidatus Woesearchaeota archaeon]